MFRIVDFLASCFAMWLAVHWGDGNTNHAWLVVAAIGVANILTLIRGKMYNHV